MNNGRVVRVRMDSEGRALEHARSALDDGFAILFHAIRQALDAGTLRNEEGDPILSLETEFPEDVYESQVREESGAVFYAGRRVVKFNLPEPVFSQIATIDTVDSLLEELRADPTIGVSIQPLVKRQPGDPAWRIHVTGDDSPGLTFEKETLFETARAAVYRYRESIAGR